MLSIFQRFLPTPRVVKQLIACSVVVSCAASMAVAQQKEVSTESERGAAAIGHYARARSLLVEALAEFELGRRMADPDMLIDSEQWRMTLVSRAEELNRILDPKPRITRSGVRFKANSRLLRQEDSPPAEAYKNGPKTTNTYAEEQGVTVKSEKERVAKEKAEKQPKKAVAATEPVVAEKSQAKPKVEELKPVAAATTGASAQEPKQSAVTKLEEAAQPSTNAAPKAISLHSDDETFEDAVETKHEASSSAPAKAQEGESLPPARTEASAPTESASSAAPAAVPAKTNASEQGSVFKEQSQASSASADDVDIEKAIEAAIQEKRKEMENSQNGTKK